jgi:hypothetical protein
MTVNQIAETDQMLEKAFLLAYFIHGDKDRARRVVVGAITKLQVATAAQNKRRYYVPRGRLSPERSSTEGFRNKVSFGQLHLLQRLIYIESEPYEIQREQGQGATTLHQEDLLVHFIKHLVRIGIKRNSFYITLGLNRLLYDYSTAETMEIYNLVVQDPGRVKDDYYYRSRKGILLHELKERFGDFLRTHRGPRGEEKLRTENGSERYAALVARCLSLFAPWNTPCSVPADFDPMTQSIPSLSNGSQLEDVTEVNRIHAVLHPACHRRLISALGLSSPAERLAVPHFFLLHDEGDSDGPRDGDHRQPQVDPADLYSIKNALSEQSNRRRKASPTLLRVLVDGRESARLDLKRTSRTTFQLQGTPELIEARAADGAGEVLLASHLIAYEELKSLSRTLKTSVVTENNQKISINISFSRNASGETAGGEVELIYRERNPLKALALLSRQISHRLNDGAEGSGPLAFPGLRPALLLLLFVAGVASIVWYAWRSSRVVPTPVTIQQTPNVSPPGKAPPTPLADREAHLPSSPGSPSKPPRAVAKPSPQSPRDAPLRREEIVRQPPTDQPGNQAVDSEPTRRLEGASNRVTLVEVRKVYVEVNGAEPLAGNVRRSVMQQLRASRFIVIDTRDDADAVLKVTVQQADANNASSSAATGLNRVLVFARLVNARGEVLWPVRHTRGARFQGDIIQVAAQLVDNLLRDVQRRSGQ